MPRRTNGLLPPEGLPLNGAANEALRQQMLLRALLGDARPGVVTGWLRQAPRGVGITRGLAAYRAHAGALAERALAAAFPTLQQLIGDNGFAALARAFWQRQPPTDGDVACWGAALPAFIEDAPTLAEEPYLADVARLEWAVHRAQFAADALPGDGAPAGLARLASDDPATLRLRLLPGTAVLTSPHPVVAIWQAHRNHAPDRFDPVRAAFAAGVGECALVTRAGWQPAVQAVSPAELRYTAALLEGRALGAALQEGGPEFDFQAWLLAALQQQRLVAVAALDEPEPA